MLMVTPHTLRFLRSQADPRGRAKRRAITREHRRRLVEKTANILRCGEPTLFAFEAFLRHSLRAGLCLRGWGWRDADGVAAEIVSAALGQLGAVRPTWKQGQPEWTQEGVIVIERTRCVRCGWRLPETHRTFCDHRCAAAHHQALHRRFVADEIGAVGHAS